jgi:hypothetical protein
MSKKYLVLTEVQGRIRVLALTSNAAEKTELRQVCGNMLDQFFEGKEIGRFIVEPWPVLDSGPQASASS